MKQNKVEFKQASKTIIETLRLLFKYEKKNLLWTITLTLIMSVFPTISIYFSQELINSIQKNMVFNVIIRYLAIYIIISIISEILNQIQAMWEGKIQIQLQYKLSKEIMIKCGGMELKDFENHKTYDKLERITNEISYKPYQTLQTILAGVSNLVTLISSFIFLSMWDFKMAALLLLVPSISLFYYLKLGKQEFDIYINRTEKERKAWYFNYILTHDFSFKEIKFLNIQNYIIDKYSNLKESFIREETSILGKKTKLSIIFEIIIQFISYIVLTTAVISASVGNLLIGNVVGLIKFVGLIQSNSKSIVTCIYAVYSNGLYMNMLFEFLDKYTTEEFIEEEKEELTKEITDIELKDVMFSYDDEKDALDNVSIRFTQGEKVAIVGPNGSGKSTMIKVISGLYKKSDGTIFINGINADNYDRNSINKNISILFQDFMKYELSVKENIGFGDIENIDNEPRINKLVEDLELSYLEKDINKRLGLWFEGGQQLSGGQWQKVALARALFKDASVYILDEPSSALDTISEKQLFDTFFNQVRDKIGIFISHRIEAAKQADRIIVMKDGKIVDYGSHDYLMKNCKIYREMEAAERYEDIQLYGDIQNIA